MIYVKSVPLNLILDNIWTCICIITRRIINKFKLNMITAIITQGLPASGKSTWARNWVNKNPKNRVRVNRDDIRRMLGPYWIPSREDLVTDIENQMILNAVMNGYSVVVDATNFRGTDRFNHLLKSYRVDIQLKEFTTSLEECIERDKNRNKEDHVGEEVIRRMYNKWLK